MSGAATDGVATVWLDRPERGNAISAAAISTDVVEDDADAWLGVRCIEPVADRETLAAIRAACRPDHRDEDLRTLDRSASRPGLKRRIEHYRQGLRK